MTTERDALTGKDDCPTLETDAAWASSDETAVVDVSRWASSRAEMDATQEVEAGHGAATEPALDRVRSRHADVEAEHPRELAESQKLEEPRNLGGRAKPEEPEGPETKVVSAGGGQGSRLVGRLGLSLSRTPRWPWLGGVGALLSIALVLGSEGRSEPDEAALQPPPVDQRVLAFESFEAGLEALRGQRWREATLRFAEARILDPENPEPARFLERGLEEAEGAERLEEGWRCLQRGDRGCAEEVLVGVDPNSLSFEARGLPLGAALRAEVPGDEGEEAGGGLIESRAAQGEPVGSATRASTHSSFGVGARGSQVPAAAGSRAAPPVGKKRAGVAPRSSRPREDQPPPKEARDVEEEARRAFEAGVRAHLSGNLERAVEHLELALSLAPGHEEARRELGAIRATLPEVFRQAYAQRRSEPQAARRKLELLTRLLPPQDELHQKAKKWLVRLGDD